MRKAELRRRRKEGQREERGKEGKTGAFCGTQVAKGSKGVKVAVPVGRTVLWSQSQARSQAGP